MLNLEFVDGFIVMKMIVMDWGGREFDDLRYGVDWIVCRHQRHTKERLNDVSFTSPKTKP